VAAVSLGDFVFGYGSLVARGRVLPTRAFHRDGFVADLRGFRRCWGVAMDNRLTLPGYKYYLDDAGHRPDVHVAFLDLRPAQEQSVNGVCLPVTEDELAALDERERNYVRREVTKFCDLAADHIRVWTYLGSTAGRRRLSTARSSGRAVIDRAYLEGVLRGFERLGRVEYAACAPSLDPDGLPILALSRHDLASSTIAT
jgi:cation transport regulator ChaC